MIKLTQLKELAQDHGLKTGIDSYAELESIIKRKVIEACHRAIKAKDTTLRPEHFKEED